MKSIFYSIHVTFVFAFIMFLILSSFQIKSFKGSLQRNTHIHQWYEREESILEFYFMDWVSYLLFGSALEMFTFSLPFRGQLNCSRISPSLYSTFLDDVFGAKVRGAALLIHTTSKEQYESMFIFVSLFLVGCHEKLNVHHLPFIMKGQIFYFIILLFIYFMLSYIISKYDPKY